MYACMHACMYHVVQVGRARSACICSLEHKWAERAQHAASGQSVHHVMIHLQKVQQQKSIGEVQAKPQAQSNGVLQLPSPHYWKFLARLLTDL